MQDIKIKDLDLYGILGLERKATMAEIRRAYRFKALKCHPDKNPDDPKAAETFLQLTKALEVLLDEAARGAYDKLIIAKEAAKQRHRDLDDKRKRFKEELEARERAAANFIPDEIKLQNEIERLRKDGAQLVQEEIRRLNEELIKEFSMNAPARDVKVCQLKVQWSKDEDNQENKYTEETLKRIFAKYGSIVALAVSDKKALIEFEDPKAAELAVKIEIGFVKNPLTVNYASSKLRKKKTTTTNSEILNQQHESESLTQRTARQSDERKRLIEELMKEDVREGEREGSYNNEV